MQHFRSFRTTCFLALFAVIGLTGCKIKVKVPIGGQVVTADGSFVCGEAQTCYIDVVDIFFDQTFIAEPAHGYYFRNWRTRDGNLCSGEKDDCHLSTAGFENNPELITFLESSEVFTLEPLFVYTIDCPDPPKPELVVSPAVGE